MGSGAIAGVIMLIVIMIFVAMWAYDYNNMGGMLKQGCTPLTDNQYGIATSYSCPVGPDGKSAFDR